MSGTDKLDAQDRIIPVQSVAHDFLFTSDWFDGSYLLRAENPLFVGVEPQVEQDIQLEIEKTVSQSQITQSNALLPTGVCTDEVIRAYRAMGIDLQKEVHEDMAANFSASPESGDAARLARISTIWRARHYRYFGP